MSTSTKNHKRGKNLDTVLALATGTAKTELGDADNKSVTAAATLNVSATEAGTTTENGHNASVTLGTTSSSTPVKAQ
jgi:cytochrome bd-type quinol oxidase subunit 1